MQGENKIRVYISAEYFSELHADAGEFFQECETGSKYFAELPADIQEGEYLGESLIACCETLLIMMNPKYEIDEQTELHCELLKLGKAETMFNLLIQIKYPNVENVYHDIMLFQQREIEEDLYAFELIGDQRIFAMD